jgi:uncharacterized protein YdaU (DUF1376 family)
LNFFKLYIGDYQRDTAHLTMAEHGAFLLMLQHYYATEKPLPAGRALHRILRAETDEERAAIDSVAAQFWALTDEGLINARADEEIGKAKEQADTNRRIARAREEKRKVERTVHEACTNLEPNHSHSHIPTSLRSVGRARATRLPLDWVPPEPDWLFATEALGIPRALVELEKFRDYWAAKAGAGGTKADWDATWRNWVRKAGEYAESRRTGEKLSAVERVRRDSEEWARRQGGDCVLDAHGEPVRAQVGQPIRLVAGRTVDEGPDGVGF